MERIYSASDAVSAMDRNQVVESSLIKMGSGFRAAGTEIREAMTFRNGIFLAKLLIDNGFYRIYGFGKLYWAIA